VVQNPPVGDANLEFPVRVLFALQGHLLEHTDQDKKEQKRQPAQCDDCSLCHVQPVTAQKPIVRQPGGGRQKSRVQ